MKNKKSSNYKHKQLQLQTLRRHKQRKITNKQTKAKTNQEHIPKVGTQTHTNNQASTKKTNIQESIKKKSKNKQTKTKTNLEHISK